MLNVKADFPIFSTHPDLIYLDSAATAQKPEVVIRAVSQWYRTSCANVHRGEYDLSLQSTAQYEEARRVVAQFLNAPDPREIIFTKNATEGINLITHGLDRWLSDDWTGDATVARWSAGDRVILSEAEHHSNLIPWQQLAQKHRLELAFVRVKGGGEIDLDHLEGLLSQRTRVLALSHCSNVLGTMVHVADLSPLLSRWGRKPLFILDASQSAPHISLDVTALGCDALVFSGHKLYGPSGTGVLWATTPLLASLPPTLTGGSMIREVRPTTATWNDLPWKFEAGTPNIEGCIGLAAAIHYLQSLGGMPAVAQHTAALSSTLLAWLRERPDLRVLGSPTPESGIVSFTVDGLHPHDLAELLAHRQVAIRAGQHCAAPLHQRLGLTASNRISFGVYTTESDLRRAFTVLEDVIQAVRTV
jgi:cysteine desulfurase/selenocysteine lyase